MHAEVAAVIAAHSIISTPAAARRLTRSRPARTRQTRTSCKEKRRGRTVGTDLGYDRAPGVGGGRHAL
jgi:hypothetical protein